MGLLEYIVSLPYHQRASIIASMLANISTITCCCDDVPPTEPHIESQLQYLSTMVSACGAYATLSACVDCISPRLPASLLSTLLSSASLSSRTPLQLALRCLYCCCRLCHLYRLRHLFALRRVAAADAGLAPLAPLAQLARPTLLASLLPLVSLAALATP